MSEDAACFNSYQCNYEGFTCKSNLTECANEYDGLQTRFNTLVGDYNELLKNSREMRAAFKSALEEFEETRDALSDARSDLFLVRQERDEAQGKLADVQACIEGLGRFAEGLVSGQRMAIDASLIEADANKQNSTPKEDWDVSQIDPADAPRAVREYLDTLDEAAFGAASEVQPKFTSHSDPASQWTAARKGPAFFSYSDNYLIDTDHGVIVDVEATRSIRQAEVGATKTMLDRVKVRFDLHPERLIADTAYGTGPMLGWLVDRKIAPHIPVLDKSGRTDGTWSRADFEWEAENDQYICPEGQTLRQFRRNYSDPNRGPTGKGTAKYRALKLTCQACPSKPRCCPNMDFRSITREEHEDARQVARDIAKTRQYDISMKLRKKVEMLFAHLKRILGLGRLRLRGPCGANDEFLLAATAQNLRKLAKIFPAPQQTQKA